MEKITEFCDICEKHPTDLKCEMCGKFICYGDKDDTICLKTIGVYFDFGESPRDVIFELNLCPKCNNKIKKSFSKKYGNKKDNEFLKEIETKMKAYFKDRFEIKQKD